MAEARICAAAPARTGLPVLSWRGVRDRRRAAAVGRHRHGGLEPVGAAVTMLAWLAAAVAAWIVLRGVARLIGGLIEWHAANIEDDWDE